MWRREVRAESSASPQNSVNLRDTAATAGDRAGVIWTLDASSALNVNLVRFGAGQGGEEHVNNEVEVIVVGVLGSGIVTVDREEHALSAGMLAFMPKVVRLSTERTSEDFAYLTTHRRRRPLQIGIS
jgi:quercetin dioxygenase-like cupin family protein